MCVLFLRLFVQTVQLCWSSCSTSSSTSSTRQFDCGFAGVMFVQFDPRSTEHTRYGNALAVGYHKNVTFYARPNDDIRQTAVHG